MVFIRLKKTLKSCILSLFREEFEPVYSVKLIGKNHPKKFLKEWDLFCQKNRGEKILEDRILEFLASKNCYVVFSKGQTTVWAIPQATPEPQSNQNTESKTEYDPELLELQKQQMKAGIEAETARLKKDKLQHERDAKEFQAGKDARSSSPEEEKDETTNFTGTDF